MNRLIGFLFFALALKGLCLAQSSNLSYYLSSDGKILVLADNNDSESGIWLVKK